MTERSPQSPVTPATDCLPTVKVWGSFIWTSPAFHTAGFRFQVSAGLSSQLEERLWVALRSSSLMAVEVGVINWTSQQHRPAQVRDSICPAARGSPQQVKVCEVVFSVNGGSIIKTFTPRQHEVFVASKFRRVFFLKDVCFVKITTVTFEMLFESHQGCLLLADPAINVALVCV